MTKEVAVMLHRNLWNWIGEYIRKNIGNFIEYPTLLFLKEKYFEERNLIPPKNACYLCQYVSTMNQTNKQGIYRKCESCPVIWCDADLKDIVNHEGVRSSVTCPCEYYTSTSPYYKLYILFNSESYYTEEMADLALKIANLPTTDSLIANIKEVGDLYLPLS